MNDSNDYQGIRGVFRAPVSAFILVVAMQSHGQEGWKKDSLLHEENFNAGSTANWISELQAPAQSTVSVRSGKLDIDVGSGATVWLNKKLAGNIHIEYDVIVVNNGGPNDRVSDLNQFWMASDPLNSNLFTRNGDFVAYDNLRLYYVGMGGNNNTTTRFRKYDNNLRPIIGEFTDAGHLLQGNTSYRIEITSYNGLNQFRVNGNLFFSYQDPAPLTEGHFA